MIKYYVFFKNSIDAFRLSQALTSIPKTLAPTPREASHCCGVCLVHDNKDDRIKIEQLAHDLHIELDGFWEREEDIDPNRMKFC